MKLLIGGSPCTHWSIAQTKNRETKPEGLGWELFLNYVIARDKFKPDYFLYENNKSMSAAIREQITKELGVEPVLVNSALVSAQNRQRLYWVGKLNPDGSYSTVPVEQPEDRGILLRDILESGVAWREKGYTLKANYSKASAVSAMDGGHFPAPMAATPVRIGSIESNAKNADYDSQQYACPVAGRVVGRRINEAGHRDDYNESLPHIQRFEVNDDPQKTNCLTTVQKDNMVAVPTRVGDMPNAAGVIRGGQAHRIYDADGKGGNIDRKAKRRRCGRPTLCCASGNGVARPQRPFNYEIRNDQKANAVIVGHQSRLVIEDVPDMRVPEATKQGCCYISPTECVDLTMPSSKTRRGRARKEKANCLTTSCDMYEYCGTIDKPIYRVEDGKITINGKQYLIKLWDGYYIIRKLTVTECKRLQTVPDDYIFPVSDTQAYKMLGNGWTVDVIAHILSHIPGITTEPLTVLSMYDGMSCGHIALDKLGAEVARYYATEIDKWAIKTTQAIYPDTVQLGDAFAVRAEDWRLEDA